MNLAPISPVPETGSSFADRIKFLIQRVGSATEIARMCGFSEGVVRSWRDGNTDPSRARCVTLARTLGISLVWLVAGEGAIMGEVDQPNGDEQYTTETTHRLRLRPGGIASEAFDTHGAGMDTQRLHAAMRILQSELDLAGNPFSLAENTDLLASLYEALGPGGTRLDTDAMLVFNRKLAERIRHAGVTA
ncbi:transcriptional regulator [Frateuria sp.]|uniref:helix-turn-helix domain-containing protein n=1 Tax=Frateuria sp. TaxID=2211372 RepID=UPI00185596D6|nr:transcriptional regulator [Frateuria sp.]NUR21554.1 transcriptional regulator [Frateuria sp.]